MKTTLLTCTLLSTVISVAQAAQGPESASGPLQLTAPQMDIATAGSTLVWIRSAAEHAALAEANRIRQSRDNMQSGDNIQLVIKISGLSTTDSFKNANKFVIPSSPGGSVSIGQTVFEGEMQ